MSEGLYRSMSFEELSGAHGRMSDAASYLRPLVDVPDNPDPAHAEMPVYLAAIGPDEVSTSMTLVPTSTLPVWDVNGYYRACGIGWPYKVTRRELARVYNDTGGPNNHDHYAAYAFMRLRDDEFREHYDRRPLGQPVDDQYRWEYARRLAADWAARQSAETGRAVSIADLLGEDVLRQMEAQAEAERRAEQVEAEREEGHSRPQTQDLPDVWPFAYYLWGARGRDEKKLATWQQMLITAFARKGLSVRVAVGYVDRARTKAVRVRHRKSDGRHVEILFLHQEADPTDALADVVVGTYHTRPYGTPLEHPLYLR